MAYTRLYTMLTLLHLASSQLVIPYCLQTCLANTKMKLCASPAASELTACITKECASPPATQNLIANLAVTYTPKIEYSCEQSMNPEAPDNSVTLDLNQTCATSPYGFKSFIPHAEGAINAANGCRVLIYSNEACIGTASSSADLGIIDGGQCIFRGGRSARLTCDDELDAAHAFIEASCGGSSSSPSISSIAAGPSAYSSDIPDAKSSSSASVSTISMEYDTSAAPLSASTSLSTSATRTTHYITISALSSTTSSTVPATETTYYITIYPQTSLTSSAIVSTKTTQLITISSPLSASTTSALAVTTAGTTSDTTDSTHTLKNSSSESYTIVTSSSGPDATTYYLTLPTTAHGQSSSTLRNATTLAETANSYIPSITMPASSSENMSSLLTFSYAPTDTAVVPTYTGVAARMYDRICYKLAPGVIALVLVAALM